MYIRTPPDWSISKRDHDVNDGIIVTMRVTAHVASLTGTVSDVTLTNAADDTVEKLHKEYRFPDSLKLKLEPILSEDALHSYIAACRQSQVLVTRIPVPRIVDQLSLSRLLPNNARTISDVHETRFPRARPILPRLFCLASC